MGLRLVRFELRGDNARDYILDKAGRMSEESADRPATLTDVEITPAMIAAGIGAVDPDDEPFLLPSEKVALIFRAMLAAQVFEVVHPVM